MEFKVGDWVTISWHETKEPYQITGIWEADTTNNVKSSSHPNSSIFFDGCANRILKDLELWQPQPGEWCWYKHMLVKVISIDKRDDGIIRYVVLAPMYAEQYSGAISLEPFLGTLPSFIKD